MSAGRGLRTALARTRHIAGWPSGLVISFFFFFYLVVNAITYFGAFLGWVGIVAPVLAWGALTAFLAWRWQSRLLESSRVSQLDAPDADRLGMRRGVIALVGLDSANPGTTFLRLLEQAQSLEYLALVTTTQDDELGVTRNLLEKLLPVSSRSLDPGKIRVWSGNNAEGMAEVEKSVGEAIAWMSRHGLHPSEIVVDVTKGRRAMEFGALIGAQKAQVEVQYLAADWHHVDNRPRPGTQGFFVVRTLWTNPGPEAAPLVGD